MINVQMFTRISLKNGFRGAQMKTWDFFHHIKAHPEFNPIMEFHPDSEWSPVVPWPEQAVLGPQTHLEEPDWYCLKGGNDWKLFEQSHQLKANATVISPIVNYRVLDERHHSNQLLGRPAVRVCPSPDLASAVRSHPLTRGLVYAIPNGIDIHLDRAVPFNEKTTDLLIVAYKRPQSGKIIRDQLSASGVVRVKMLEKPVAHAAFLDLLADARVILHLPQDTEANYIPGLEGMLQGGVSIMPDCRGNRFYVNDGENGFIGTYDLEWLVKQVKAVLSRPDEALNKISMQAREQARQFSLEHERAQWHQMLDEIKASA